jgi:hypothetical protein
LPRCARGEPLGRSRDLVAFLERGIVHELEVPVGDREFQDVEFLLVALEDERGVSCVISAERIWPSIWI